MTSLRDLAEKSLQMAKAATDGPWQANYVETRKGCRAAGPLVGHAPSDTFADAAFIAFAREALPQLAAAYLMSSVEVEHHAIVIGQVRAKLAIAREALEYVLSHQTDMKTAYSLVCRSALEATK